MSRRSSRRLSPSKAQELQVAAAVAREAILHMLADHALALVRHAAGDVSEQRMLDIYLRLLGLTGHTADAVANRVLASLGHSRPTAQREVDTEGDAKDVAPDSRSMLRTLHRRLRGRVNDELRHIVELQTGAAQAALLDLHVRHARGFVRLLEGSHSIGDACDDYIEALHVPPRFAGVLYILVVDRIAADDGIAWRRSTLVEPGVPAAARRPELNKPAASRQHRARRPA